jgi:hypothetical protein
MYVPGSLSIFISSHFQSNQQVDRAVNSAVTKEWDDSRTRMMVMMMMGGNNDDDDDDMRGAIEWRRLKRWRKNERGTGGLRGGG